MADYPKDFLPGQTDSVMAQFAIRRKRQLIAGFFAMAVIAGGFLVRTGLFGEAPFGLVKDGYLLVFLPTIAAVLVFSLWNWRCPACRKYLGRGFDLRYCPKCGAQFRSDNEPD